MDVRHYRHDLAMSIEEPPLAGYMGIPFMRPIQSQDLPAVSSMYQPASENGRWIGGNLPTPDPQDGSPPDDPWPMEFHASPSQRIILPPLGEATEPYQTQKHYSTRVLSSSVHSALRHGIELPSERSPWRSVAVESFPNQQTLDHCIDMYFVHFHQTLPIIHRPTFDPGESLIVTLAIISIGACHSDLEGCDVFASAVSELTRRLLVFMAEHDRRFVRTESLLTAQLLQALYGYGSGNERLFELSESCRSSIVYHAKYMGLFGDPEFEPGVSDALEDTWKEWIRQERLRRLGWAVYEYDACISLLQNDRPLLNIADARMALPCSMKHWDAESAYAWVSMYPTINSILTLTPSLLQPAIKSVLGGNREVAEKLTNERHRIIILLSLSRVLWSLKEVKLSLMEDLIGDNMEGARRKILDAIDSFWQFPVLQCRTHTRAEVGRSVHAMHIIHLAHIYGAGNLMNHYYSFLRNCLLRKTEKGKISRTHMLQWASQNLQLVREVAFHCAQILALTRQFPENMSMEPFMVFHAGVFLMLMAQFLPPTGQRLNRGLRIDHLGSPGDPISDSISNWVRDGGENVISVHGVPVLCCEIGWKQVLDEAAEILKRMRVWRLSQKLLKVMLTIRDGL
ncbi:hypothetical protein B7463_g10388, partial [Scytalidium lignicola]